MVVYAQRIDQIDCVQVVDGNAGAGVEVNNLLLAIFGVLTGCVIGLFPSVSISDVTLKFKSLAYLEEAVEPGAKNYNILRILDGQSPCGA